MTDQDLLDQINAGRLYPITMAQAREEYLSAILGLLAQPLANQVWAHVREHGCGSGDYSDPYPTLMSCPVWMALEAEVPRGYFVYLA